ncbi:MAG TPA: rRNA adenine N(6)-methyltransferase family protein [Acidimicrobiales bacterium]|nr:rRNA adenine N(6)-methyltransferase family protein [Acidimicrobiales bacterium]
MAGPSRTRWGWHRLDRHWAGLLVADAGVGPGDLVVDVGAGSGALTVPLVAAGARVIAVELHPDRARRLRHEFRGRPVTVVEADAADLRLPRRPFRVVANPPFAVTTALVRRLLAPGSRLVAADLVVPRYVARRWVGPGAPGRARWTRSFTVSTGRTVPRRALHPPPPCDAVVLVVRRRPGTLPRP